MSIKNTEKQVFTVIHPLDDEADVKRNVSSLGLMPMTKNTRLSLVALRTYVIVMSVLIFYHIAMVALH